MRSFHPRPSSPLAGWIVGGFMGGRVPLEGPVSWCPNKFGLSFGLPLEQGSFGNSPKKKVPTSLWRVSPIMTTRPRPATPFR